MSTAALLNSRYIAAIVSEPTRELLLAVEQILPPPWDERVRDLRLNLDKALEDQPRH